MQRMDKIREMTIREDVEMNKDLNTEYKYELH